MSDAVTRYPEDQSQNLALVNDPEKMLDSARKACTALMRVVEEKHLYEDIGKQRHLKVEAWLLAAHFYGVAPRLVSVCGVVDDMTGAAGFEAIVEAVHISTGRVIGQSAARCLNNEDNWGERPKYSGKGENRKQIGTVRTPSYQLESMAQTRATSKVLSSLFRFVVILGGTNISGTPAEETVGGTMENGQHKEPPAEKITDGQRKRIFAIAKEKEFPYNDLPALFKKHGFEQAADVTRDKYDGIIAEIQARKTAA